MGGGNELSFGISRTVPPGPSFPLCSRRKNMQTQQCRALCQSPPPVLTKMHFPPRDPRCAPSTQPATQYPFWKETFRKTGIRREKKREGDRKQAAAAAMLQRRYCEQDIPKQLEEADIWCCALVLGPPQNGPVLSGNLVIFSASLARLQL